MCSATVTLNRRLLVRPGTGLDPYPERVPREEDALLRWGRHQAQTLALRSLSFRRFAATAERIQAQAERLRKLSVSARQAELQQVRCVLRTEGFAVEAVVLALAHASANVRDRKGFSLHREQYYCAWLLLNGVLAEMATGEGKSITAGVTAAVAALAGLPVHVITTNDYLVARDAQSVRPLIESFGLTVKHVTPEQDEDERRAAYAADVCYVSNKQVVFDYLKDRQRCGESAGSIAKRVQPLLGVQVGAPLLRGLNFAIVDEADCVLIDDAITPLILSQQVDGEDFRGRALTAMSLARRLDASEHFQVDQRTRRATLSEAGEYRLSSLAGSLEGIWKNRRYRDELVRQALAAQHLFLRDRDYIVRNDEVQLIDQSTGRVMPDRKLQHGLHQMVETKERCEQSGRTETISSMSFQRFFARYHHLCGMSGTVKEAAPELARVYGLSVLAVPTHRATRRRCSSPIITRTPDHQQERLVEEVRRCVDAGRPVLVGTRSVSMSEQLSQVLTDAHIHHRVLNARQDQEEADVVARGGASGAVTIATNMAGRGTDIPLDSLSCEHGGLQVLVAQLNDNQRIDRQLIGRAARQGDPGSYRYVISLQDELLQRTLPRWLVTLLGKPPLLATRLGRVVTFWLCRQVQAQHERAQRGMRRRVAKTDARTAQRLSFIGHKE